MTTIFNDAGEQEIRSVVLYANENKLYTDDKHEVAAAKGAVLELCMKGMLLVFDTDTYYTVTSFKDGTVSYGTDKTATVE